MVSFSCEACGDVLTKKKLDAHHRQCRGSSFTCLDCMTHFPGTEFRSHTSCITEDQKYQGTLYKEKSSKKSVKISEPKQRPRSAYVEEAPDPDSGNAIAIVDAPPAAPSPPTTRHKQPPQQERPVSVFDFLVNGETPKATPHATPNPSRGSESMKMADHAPNIFGNGDRRSRREEHHETHIEDSYKKHGYTYGEDPVPVHQERPRIEYITPAPKHRYNTESQDSLHYMGDSEKRSSMDKKRKRTNVEELDLTAARRPSQEPDTRMEDAPPQILHSGLTGGLNRLLTKSQYPPSPDYSHRHDQNPSSPPKRSKSVSTAATTTTTTTTKEKDRDRGISRSRNGALVKIRQRRSSSESQPLKKQQRSHHSPEPHNHPKPKLKAIEDTSRPKRKEIEYHPHSESTNRVNPQQQLTIPIKSRAELFMSFVTKGPDSEQGYSVHKALKRYHREREELGVGLEKNDEERELWRGLRLKRNERGEVVVFF